MANDQQPSASFADGCWTLRTGWSREDVVASAGALNAYYRWRRKPWKPVITVVAIIGGIALLLALVVIMMLMAALIVAVTPEPFEEIFGSSYFLIVFLAVVFLTLCAINYLVRVRDFWKHKGVSRELLQEFDSGSVRSGFPGLRSEMTWSNVVDLIDGEKYLLLVDALGYYVSAPKRCFQNADELQSFIAFCMEQHAAAFETPITLDAHSQTGH